MVTGTFIGKRSVGSCDAILPLVLACVLLTSCGAPYYVQRLDAPQAAPRATPVDPPLGPVGIWTVTSTVPPGKYIGGVFSQRSSLLRTRDQSIHWMPDSMVCLIRESLQAALAGVGFTVPDSLARARQTNKASCGALSSWTSALRSADALLSVEVEDISINEYSAAFFSKEQDLELRLQWRLLTQDGVPAAAKAWQSYGKGSKKSRNADERLREALSGSARENVEQILRNPGLMRSLADLRKTPEQRAAIADEVETLARTERERAAAEQARREAAEREAREAERRRGEQEEADRRRRREQEEADRRAAETAEWRRPRPAPDQLIWIGPADLRPVTRATTLERVEQGVVALLGDQLIGMAFLISKDGLALTNEHVTSGQTSLRAVFADGRQAPVRVLRVNADADVALVQVLCPMDCFTVSMSPQEPSRGAEVYLLGSPRGFEFSVTRGIISGVRLSQPGITFLQTDAAANPGNSGGPLFDAVTGRVYGIVTWKYTQSEGLTFAVAVPDALRVLGIRFR